MFQHYVCMTTGSNLLCTCGHREIQNVEGVENMAIHLRTVFEYQVIYGKEWVPTDQILAPNSIQDI